MTAGIAGWMKWVESKIGTGTARTAYTPGISADAGTLTSATTSGRYVVIGKEMRCSIKASITNAGTASGGLLLSLPFNADLTVKYVGSGRETQATGHAVTATLTNPMTIQVWRYDNGSIIATGRTVELVVICELA